MPDSLTGLASRMAALEATAADHEERLIAIEAEVAALIMASGSPWDRADVQRILVASLNADGVRIAENTELAISRLEGALRVLAGYRGFARSQREVLDVLDRGLPAHDALTPNVLTEPLL